MEVGGQRACADKLELAVADEFLKFLNRSLRGGALQGPPHLQPLRGGAGKSAKLPQNENCSTFISLQMKRREGLAVSASVTVVRMWVTLVLK